MKPYKIKFDWLKFGQSYLVIALLACDEMIENKYKDKILPKSKIEFNKYQIHVLFLPALYNTKHGIEVFIKTLRKILGVDKVPKDHNVVELFEKLKELIDEGRIQKVITDKEAANPSDADLPAAKEDLRNIKKYINILEKLVIKYQCCDFLKGKIGNDFEIEDGDNTAFRYPENSLKIQMNYEEILLRITKEDIEKIKKDIEALWENFNGLGYILEIYSQYK